MTKNTCTEKHSQQKGKKLYCKFLACFFFFSFLFSSSITRYILFLLEGTRSSRSRTQSWVNVEEQHIWYEMFHVELRLVGEMLLDLDCSTDWAALPESPLCVNFSACWSLLFSSHLSGIVNNWSVSSRLPKFDFLYCVFCIAKGRKKTIKLFWIGKCRSVSSWQTELVATTPLQ